MANTNNGYLADTKNATYSTMSALNDIAGKLGISTNGLSSTDLTKAIKTQTGTSGNTYGDTIGNKTLKNYGYQVDEAGNISKIQVSLPGIDRTFDADLVTPEIYMQAALNEQVRAQNEAMINMLQEQYAQQQNALKAQTQATVNSINSNRQGIEDAYQQAQKEAYINSVLQQNQMGDYLTASGYTGGMAESTLAQINNNYANNRQNATSERDAANMEINRLVAEAQATGDSQLAQAANNYYNNYLSALQNQQQLDYQMNQNLMGQFNDDRTYKAQQAQRKLENSWVERDYVDGKAQQDLENSWVERDYAADQKSEQDGIARTAAASDFETFLNTFEGKYTKKATYEKWIQNLKAMDDPYGFNKQKIDYLQKYINSTFGKKKTTGGTDGTVVSAGAKTLVETLRSKFPAGITAEQRANAVQNAITQGLANGTIVEGDEDYILSAFGY